MRRCNVKIQYPDNQVVDLVETYDFHLIESPAMIVPKVSKYETIQHPETSAPEIDTRTLKQPFDYKISLGYYGRMDCANTLIRNFFDSLFDKIPETEVFRAREITLINEWKSVKMKGFAKTWDEKTYTIEGENGLIIFDFTLYVNDPNTMEEIK